MDMLSHENNVAQAIESLGLKKACDWFEGLNAHKQTVCDGLFVNKDAVVEVVLFRNTFIQVRVRTATKQRNLVFKADDAKRKAIDLISCMKGGVAKEIA